MRKIKKIPVTKEGFEKLQKELLNLKALRPQAVETLSEARKLGDLSENGLYTAAKMRLRSIDSQIFRINAQIKLADIIEENKSGVVGLGSKVKVSDGKSKRLFYIVGDYEADPLNGKITSNSPIGKSLMRKKVRDEILVKTPSGIVKYKILEIL